MWNIYWITISPIVCYIKEHIASGIKCDTPVYVTKETKKCNKYEETGTQGSIVG